MLTHRHAINSYVSANRDRVLALLARLVAEHSISWCKAGVDAVGTMAVGALPPGFHHDRIPQDVFGDHHVLRRPARRAGACRVVLVGHLDTMCPLDPSFDRLVEQGDRLLGPGVMDMKGGDVVLIWALCALHDLGLLDDLDTTVIFNSDEELGSPTSNSLFTEMRNKADLALVFEASSPTGSIVTTRRGVCRSRLHIEGVEHHFGMLRGAKVSALHEAAHKTLQIEALNRDDGSIAANVGKIEGGLAANKVAHRAQLDFETRCWDEEVHARTIAHTEALVTAPVVPGCRITLERLAFRPPMRLRPEHRWCLELAQGIAGTLGQPMDEEARGGVSDACWLSHVGIPTLDGLGPRGDHDFTPDEYCDRESLFERIELVANLLAVLAGRPTPTALDAAPATPAR